jgi:pimeloyl-ACP methyl ester carboxylesterase
VGEYPLTITCKGSGKPTIILENGFGYISWYQPKYSAISQTCVYTRVGMGSEKAKNPRTTQDQVKDLHDLLLQAQIPGPYILVGHAYAASNLVLFTDTYPDEVVGLVCVDCRYVAFENLFMEMLNKVYASDPEKDMKIRKFAQYYYLSSKFPNVIIQNTEGLDFIESARQVMKVTSLGDRPFVVLSATSHQFKSVVPEIQRNNDLMEEAWVKGSEVLSQLSTRGRVEILPGTDYRDILANPAIPRAIQEVYNQVVKH